MERVGYFPFEDLEVYRLAVRLSARVYQLTSTFPSEERFGLTNQLRRAAVSIALNIAEGRGRVTDKELIRFLVIARGSLFEVVSASEIASELGYLEGKSYGEIRQDANTLNAKLMALIKHLEGKVQ